MDKILILGASGLVGKALLNELNKKYEVYGTYKNNRIGSIQSIYFDISGENNITDILNTVIPLKIVYLDDCKTNN